MKRTQLYMDEEEFEVLDVLARQRKKTISELVREAVRKAYVRKKSLDPVTVLNETFGLWKGRKELGTTKAYVRKLRKDGRLERFGINRD